MYRIGGVAREAGELQVLLRVGVLHPVEAGDAVVDLTSTASRRSPPGDLDLDGLPDLVMIVGYGRGDPSDSRTSRVVASVNAGDYGFLDHDERRWPTRPPASRSVVSTTSYRRYYRTVTQSRLPNPRRSRRFSRARHDVAPRFRRKVI